MQSNTTRRLKLLGNYYLNTFNPKTYLLLANKYHESSLIRIPLRFILGLVVGAPIFVAKSIWQATVAPYLNPKFYRYSRKQKVNLTRAVLAMLTVVLAVTLFTLKAEWAALINNFSFNLGSIASATVGITLTALFVTNIAAALLLAVKSYASRFAPYAVVQSSDHAVHRLSKDAKHLYTEMAEIRANFEGKASSHMEPVFDKICKLNTRLQLIKDLIDNGNTTSLVSHHGFHYGDNVDRALEDALSWYESSKTFLEQATDIMERVRTHDGQSDPSQILADFRQLKSKLGEHLKRLTATRQGIWERELNPLDYIQLERDGHAIKLKNARPASSQPQTPRPRTATPVDFRRASTVGGGVVAQSPRYGRRSQSPGTLYSNNSQPMSPGYAHRGQGGAGSAPAVVGQESQLYGGGSFYSGTLPPKDLDAKRVDHDRKSKSFSANRGGAVCAVLQAPDGGWNKKTPSDKAPSIGHDNTTQVSEDDLEKQEIVDEAYAESLGKGELRRSPELEKEKEASENGSQNGEAAPDSTGSQNGEAAPDSTGSQNGEAAPHSTGSHGSTSSNRSATAPGGTQKLQLALAGVKRQQEQDNDTVPKRATSMLIMSEKGQDATGSTTSERDSTDLSFKVSPPSGSSSLADSNGSNHSLQGQHSPRK